MNEKGTVADANRACVNVKNEKGKFERKGLCKNEDDISVIPKGTCGMSKKGTVVNEKRDCVNIK